MVSYGSYEYTHIGYKGHGNGSVHERLAKKELMMIHNSEHDREVKASQSNYVKFRFEIITTCCAAIFGTLFLEPPGGFPGWVSG